MLVRAKDQRAAQTQNQARASNYCMKGLYRRVRRRERLKIGMHTHTHTNTERRGPGAQKQTKGVQIPADS
jgi:hypothetical protein